MWSKILKSFARSPWLGHGYFVSSENGKLFVWGEWGNWTAHNIWLQTLVTTGIFGFGLVVAYVLRLYWHAIHLAYLSADSCDRLVGRIGLILLTWFMGWGS